MGAAEPGLAMRGAFRDATSLVQEATGKVREAWSALAGAAHELSRRFVPFAAGHDLARRGGLLEDPIVMIDAQMARLRPAVDAVVGTLASTAGQAVPVFALFDAAAALGDAADHLSGLATEMTGRGALESWSGSARDAYDQRVREQIDAADATAAEVAAAARWLAEVGAANTAYVTNVGHLGAETVSRLTLAAVEAGAGEIPGLLTTLDRLAAFLSEAGPRTAGWARDLHDHLTTLATRADAPRLAVWPTSTKIG